MPKAGPNSSSKPFSKNAPKSLLDSLDALIERHHLLKHPFYQAWTEGKLSKESLQLYAGQYYQHVRSFPENLKQLSTRSTGNLQTLVKENLAEEIDPTAPHPQLWREFAASLGVSDATLDATHVLPGIAALLDTFDEVAAQGTMAQAVAMFYTYEAQVPEIASLTISNVPAVLDNHAISLPSSVWTVAAACSGLRFLLSSVVLGTFFSFLVYRSRWRRLIFIGASIAVPIVGNGLRAYGTILLAYYTNNKLASGLDHVVYGGVFSVFLQLLLMLVGLRWRENPSPTRQPGRNRFGSPALGDADPLPSIRALLASATVVGIVALAPTLAASLWNRSSAATEWPDPPVIVMSPWQAAAAGDTSWALEWNGSQREFSQRYESDARRIDLYWVLYSGRQAMNWPITSDGTDGSRSWTMAGARTENVIVDGQSVKSERRLIESGAESRVVWTCYWVSGEYTASRARVRLLQAKARLFGEPAMVAVINLAAGNELDAPEAERTLQNFLLHASFRVRSEATGPTL